MKQKILEYITNGLTAAAEAEGDYLANFRIFADAGERESVRTNDFETRPQAEIDGTVYGTVYIDPSNRAPIKGLSVLTIRATLELLCEIRREPTTGEGYYPELERLQRVVESFASSQNGQSFEHVDGGTAYTIVPNFSPAVVGDVQEVVSNFGEVLPIFVSIVFTAVEQGVNSNDVTIYVDGYPVYYESAVLTRSKMVDQYTYSQGKPIESNVVQHGFGVDFVSPLLSNALGEKFTREILAGSFNAGHSVFVATPSIKKSYFCVFGNSSANLQPGKNVGVTLSFVEANNELTPIPEGWTERELIRYRGVPITADSLFYNDLTPGKIYPVIIRKYTLKNGESAGELVEQINAYAEENGEEIFSAGDADYYYQIFYLSRGIEEG